MNYCYKLLVLFFVLILPSATFAQQDISKIEEDLKHLLNSNNTGTEFYFSIPPAMLDYSETYF